MAFEVAKSRYDYEESRRRGLHTNWVRLLLFSARRNLSRRAFLCIPSPSRWDRRSVAWNRPLRARDEQRCALAANIFIPRRVQQHNTTHETMVFNPATAQARNNMLVTTRGERIKGSFLCYTQDSSRERGRGLIVCRIN